MVASVLIMAVSIALLLYWFRYSCVLILTTRTTRDYSASVALANQLSFAGVQDRLAGAGTADLDSIQKSLDRDFRLVMSLLRQAGAIQIGGDRLEDLMLRLDFRLMAICYRIASRFSEARSRAALAEMSQIVGYFANTVGERAAASARA